MTTFSAGHVFGKQIEVSASGKYAILQSAPVAHPLALHVVNAAQLNEPPPGALQATFERELATLIEKYKFFELSQECIAESIFSEYKRVLYL